MDSGAPKPSGPSPDSLRYLLSIYKAGRVRSGASHRSEHRKRETFDPSFYRLFPETTEYMQCTGSQQKESLAAAAAGTRRGPAARKLPGPCVRDHGRQDTIKEHGTNSSPWKFHLSGACATPELLTQLRLRGNPLRAPTHSHTRYLLW